MKLSDTHSVIKNWFQRYNYVRFFSTILTILYFTVLNAQTGIKTNAFKGYQPIKGDYLYISETEISNGQYHEFLNALRAAGDTQAYLLNRPDTTVWLRGPMQYGEPFKAYYFQHPAYRDYPVVGITQKQATAWCAWKAGQIELAMHLQVAVHLRLPTESEWLEAATKGTSGCTIYPWAGESIRITEGKKRDLGKIRLNCNLSKGNSLEWNDGGFITTPVYAYWPNGIGIYNISGNVAEWLSEPGKTKGGSWAQLPYYSRIDVPGYNDGDTSATAWKGFRPVLEVVEYAGKKRQVETQFPHKGFEKNFSLIDSNLYAGISEVTNELYNKFVRSGHLIFAEPADSLWSRYTPYQYMQYYSVAQSFSQYPVVNIDYESATEFCNWLTEKYNAWPERKFRQVVFRLPTSAEWLKMGSGKRDGPTYPWGGPFARNSRGSYLANFHPKPDAYISEDSTHGIKLLAYNISNARAADGLEFTGPVTSYFPNDLGFYCAAGNVSEMLQTEGEARGGSWNSDLYYLQLGENNIEHFQGPSPTVGFRLFMEVIQK